MTNACGNANLAQLEFLIEKGLIDVIIDVLRNTEETKLVIACLEAIDNMYYTVKEERDFPPNENPITIKIYEAGGFPLIEGLQSHPNREVYDLVSKIIDQHLEVEDPNQS